MALLVTLFLVLVNIFNSVTANAPKSEGLTAVETWVVMCILHVFCVLLEYAIILKLIQSDKRRGERTRKELTKALVSNNAKRNGSSAVTSDTQRITVVQQSGSSTPLEQIFETDPDYVDARTGAGTINPVSASAAVQAFGDPSCRRITSNSSADNIMLNNTCRHRQQVSNHHHIHRHQFQQTYRSNESLDNIPDAEASWNKINLLGKLY